MSETEILKQILQEIKEINNTLQDIYSSNEAQHEMLMNRLSSLEGTTAKTNNILSNIESLTKS